MGSRGAGRWHEQAIVRFGGRSGAHHRLVCVPYAGAGVAAYRDWPDLYPRWLEVNALRLPGRETRIAEPPLAEVPGMVAALIEPLRAVALQAPQSYSLFGHSLGAIVCFELAREVRRRGYPPPARMFISGRCAPQVDDDSPQIHHLPPGEFLTAVHQLGGTPPELLEATELLEVLLPVLRADFTAAETYQYQADRPLDVPIAAFGGHDDPLVPVPALAAWEAQTTAGFTMRLLPGDHFFLHSQRAAVAAAICADLAGAARH